MSNNPIQRCMPKLSDMKVCILVELFLTVAVICLDFSAALPTFISVFFKKLALNGRLRIRASEVLTTMAANSLVCS
jgi:hypothetical protein